MEPIARRDTQQRRVVLKVVTEAGRPLSPQEILEYAQPDLPKLGIATVYRNVKALLADGLLQSVELPGEGLRYEAAGKHHHHHFHCKTCGKVFEIEGCCGHYYQDAPPNFTVDEHVVVLYGKCAGCSAEEQGQALPQADSQASAPAHHECHHH